MRYIGGKSRIAKELANILQPMRKNRRVVEPFCGGLSATVALKPDVAGDISVPLMSLIFAMREGWTPPDTLSEEEYNQARKLPPENPLHGFAAFGCSFGGKYWGGYAREKDRNFALNAKRALLKKIKEVSGTEFYCGSYQDIFVDCNTLVYCDPPYKSTTIGYSTKKWCPITFWKWAQQQSDKGAIVVVSEFSAPEGVIPFKTINSCSDLRTVHRTQDTSENLYVLWGL